MFRILQCVHIESASDVVGVEKSYANKNIIRNLTVKNEIHIFEYVISKLRTIRSKSVLGFLEFSK